MVDFEGCHIGGLIQDGVARTRDVNRALADGAGAEHPAIQDYLNFVTAEGIDVVPQASPLQIAALRIACRACRGECVVSSTRDLIEISLPATCWLPGLAPGQAAVGNGLIPEAGQQG